MKKEMWNRAKAFVFFESPLQVDLINGVFNSTHNYYLQEFPGWTYSATRKKLIFEFWSKKVFTHFGVILIAAICGVVICTTYRNIFIQSLFIAAFVSFQIVTSKIYWPAYFSDFLPKLDMIIEEKKKMEKAENELHKCRRSQYTIPTLIIIYYVQNKASGCSLLPASDKSAELLNRLYGVDRNKIKINLARLCRVATLSVKEKAEMLKGVENARDFFSDLNFQSAQLILDQLELKLSRS